MKEAPEVWTISDTEYINIIGTPEYYIKYMNFPVENIFRMGNYQVSLSERAHVSLRHNK